MEKNKLVRRELTIELNYMNTDTNKNNILSNELQPHILYIESILESYKNQLTIIQKSNHDFCEHFIPESQLDEISNYLKQLDELEEGISTLLPKISSEISLLPSYEYVTSMRNCLSGSTPEAIRLMTFLAEKAAYSLEQKLMVSLDLKGERLVEVTDTYNKERNLLANRAIEKEKFLKKTALEKKQSVIKLSNNRVLLGGSVKTGVTVGDIISFGSYPQDEDGGSKPIEWRVLAREGEKVLLISRYALDSIAYHNEWEYTTWEDCTLRKWLNDDFIDQAFSEEEKALISETKVTADENPEYDTDSGNDTTDKVFLLSIPEAEKHFKDEEDRKCAPTDYAVEQEISTDDSEEVDGKPTCWWWLRSPGDRDNCAAYIYSDGSVDLNGDSVCYDFGGIRPALWINL